MNVYLQSKFLEGGIAGWNSKCLYSFAKYCQIPSIEVILFCISAKDMWDSLFLHSLTIRIYCQAFDFLPI